MVQMSDVNTTDIIDAIRLGCRAMSRVFNPADHDLPYFRVFVRPQPFLGLCMPDHVPGRHLNALLGAVLDSMRREESRDDDEFVSLTLALVPLPNRSATSP